MSTYITRIYCYDSKYYIVKEDKYFLAIKSKYVNEDGTLKIPLNGLDMNADVTIGGCIRKTVLFEAIDHYMDEGMSLNDAMNCATALVDGYTVDELNYLRVNNERIEK